MELLEGTDAGARMAVPSVEESLSGAQRGRIMGEAALRAREALDGDAHAQGAIDAMLSEMRPAEACEALGIPAAEFEPARKRAKRMIERVASSILQPRPRTGAVDRRSPR